MGYINPKGRDWGSVVNWDDLGKFYASFAIAWTVILLAGASWLVAHRSLPFLKMRNLPLAITATSFLHIYLIKVLLAYTTNGHFLCSAEFWIMSIYLPFGIALFQANMMQLLSISFRQRRLLEKDSMSDRQLPHGSSGVRGLWSRWRALDPLKKTYVFIGIGMLLQLVVTAAIYGTNRKLQGYWGNIPKPKGQVKCRKGLEWIPSSIWQLFWSCLYGPYLLCKIWHVRDTHYWRLQTVLCIVSGFPGSPMWLAALWSVKFKPINRYWIPPLWLAPGIIVMQAVTIFFPIYEAYRSRSEARSMLGVLEEWAENRAARTLGSDSGKLTKSSESSAEDSTAPRWSVEMYGMAALENALVAEPHSLLQFAATKDFTAENIIFLQQVQSWRIACGDGLQKVSNLPAETRMHLFQMAVRIYAESVSEQTAEFPINIEGSIRARLDSVFKPAVTASGGTGYGKAVDPLSAEMWGKTPVNLLVREVHSSSSAALSEETKVDMNGVYALAICGPGDLVEGFDEGVFDAAEKSVKYLVLTNTWRKFVDARRERSPSASSDGLG